MDPCGYANAASETSLAEPRDKRPPTTALSVPPLRPTDHGHLRRRATLAGDMAAEASTGGTHQLGLCGVFSLMMCYGLSQARPDLTGQLPSRRQIP